MKTTIYSPVSPLRNPLVLFFELLRDIWKNRELIFILFIRDVKGAYRQSILGYFWIILPPLGTTAAWYYLTSQNIVNIAETTLPYPVFVFTGQLLWGTFVAAVNSPLQSFSQGLPVFTKLNVAPEAFILAGVARLVFDLLVKLILLVPFFIAFMVRPNFTIFFVPFVLLGLISIGMAIGVLAVPIGSLYQDVSRILALVMPLLMYTAPVVYPPPKTGFAATVLAFNPVTPLIVSGRNFLTGEKASLADAGIAIAASAVVLTFGLILLRTFKQRIIERMGM